MKRSLVLIASLAMATSAQAAVYTSTTTAWYLHVNGSTQSAGGFDSGMAGTTCGTNLADVDSSSMTWTDIGTDAASSKYINTPTGGLSAAMQCNSIQIGTYTATNMTPGYYFIQTVLTSTAAILDRNISTAAGAGSSALGIMGGAFKDFSNFATVKGGTGYTVPLIQSPLSPGQTINIQGSGSLDGSTTDYALPSFNTYPNGNATAGPIHIVGYNGRPYLAHTGIFANSPVGWIISHVKFADGAGGTAGGITNNAGLVSLIDSIVDQLGKDETQWITGTAVSGQTATILNNEFRNSGPKTAGTSGNSLLSIAAYANLISGNYIHDSRNEGIVLQATHMATIYNNIISSCARSGILDSGTGLYGTFIFNNTLDSNKVDGYKGTSLAAVGITSFYNNLVTNSVGFCEDFTVSDSSTLYNMSMGLIGNNDCYNNSSGNYNKINPGANDLYINPNYTTIADGSTANFTPGNTSLKVGFQTSFPGTATNSYGYIGAVQPQCVSSGGGTKACSFSQ